MSKKKKAVVSKIVLRAGLNIGQLAAEDDAIFLKEAFVSLPLITDLLDLQNPKSVVLGRTGAGKTAVLSHIKDCQAFVYEVRPTEVSLNYISNSTVIKFFNELGVDLDVFYQLLWRHVIAVELIRQRYTINSENENRSFLSRLQEAIFPNERQKAAIDYLRNWQSKFWITWDERIKEITNKFEGDLSAAAQASAPGLSMKSGASLKLGSEEKQELVARGQGVVNSVQIVELTRVIELLAQHAFNDRNLKYYLLIDDLDQKWVDESIQFKLIRALVETIKVFRRMDRLKIVIALRADILERVYSETRDLGFQLDKYEGYTAKLRWTDKELKVLVDRRVSALFKRQYTKANVVFEDIFRTRIGDTEPFKYLLDRTLMRPRDLIAFVNECLAIAEGRTEITAQVVRSAEQTYSKQRLAAIQDEWQSVHPYLDIGIEFLANKNEYIDFSDFCEHDGMEARAIRLLEVPQKFDDKVILAAQSFIDNDNNSNVLRLARLYISVLYKVGLVGLKTEKNQTFNYCYINSPIMLEHQVTDDCKIRVHPMFWRALNTRP